jgi:hypothetical protein
MFNFLLFRGKEIADKRINDMADKADSESKKAKKPSRTHHLNTSSKLAEVFQTSILEMYRSGVLSDVTLVVEGT